MGIYQYDDLQTGQGYDLDIVGDAPTEEEFARLANKIQQDRSAFLDDYKQRYGIEIEFDDGTAFGRNLRSSGAAAKSDIGELIESSGQGLGISGLERFGSQMEEAGEMRQGELSLSEPARVGSYKEIDSGGDLLSFLGGTAGGSIPYMGAAAVGAGLGALTGLATPLVGAGLATAPLFFGSNINERENVVGEDQLTGKDFATAAGVAAFQSSVEAIGLKGLSRLGLGRKVIADLKGEVGRNLFGRVATGVPSGVAIEGTTELLQELATVWQAGYDLDTPEIQDRLAEAIVAGGLLGGSIGGVGRGLLGKRPEKATSEEV